MTFRRNLYASLAGQWTAAAIAMLASLAVARLLTPTELGVFTVAMSIVGVLNTIQSLGSNSYVMYAKDIDFDIRRSGYGLNLITSSILTLLILISAPLIGEIYQSEGVRNVALIVAVNTMIGVLSTPIIAMLNRHQEFTIIGGVNAATTFVLCASQICLILLGWSYLGLAIGILISTIFSNILFFLLRPSYILLLPSFKNMSPIFRFGSKMFGVGVLNQVYNSITQILIGATNGVAIAAMYGRSNTITNIYTQFVARAIDPVLSARLAAEGRTGDDLTRTILLSSRLLTAVSIPFFAFVGIYAHLLVPFLFGPQWDDAILPMRILCCGFAVWPLTSPTTAMLIASHKMTMLLRIKGFNVLARIILVLLASPFGLPFIAAAVSTSIYVNLVQSILAARRVAGISFSMLSSAVSKSAIVAVVVIAGIFLTQFGLSYLSVPEIVELACAAVAAGSLWLFALAATDHPLWIECKTVISRLRR